MRFSFKNDSQMILSTNEILPLLLINIRRIILEMIERFAHCFNFRGGKRLHRKL